MAALDGIIFDVAMLATIVFIFPFARRKVGSFARNHGTEENVAELVERDTFIALATIALIGYFTVRGEWAPVTIGYIALMGAILAYDTITLLTDVEFTNPLTS